MFASEISTVSESEEEISASKTLDEYFTSECDLAMLFGLTYDQYWFGEPEMFYACAKTYKTKTEQLAQERDTLAWLTGQYVLAALNVTFSYAFGKKGAPKGSYPELPFYVQEHNEMANRKKQERDLQRSYNNFIAAAQFMGKLQTPEPR